jgi:hypothetical protein
MTVGDQRNLLNISKLDLPLKAGLVLWGLAEDFATPKQKQA